MNYWPLLLYLIPGLIATQAEVVHYSDFGAVGDGTTDDINAIAAAHAYANQHDLPVKADDEATYYIGGSARTVVIRTDTDFGTANFVIDDTEVEDRKASVFLVSSKLKPFTLKGLTSLKKNQKRIDVPLPGACLIKVTNSKRKHYIRLGANQNSGSPQTDIFIADKDGNVSEDSPIIWDFDTITAITARPIDEKTLTITGGRFTTIANQAESKYTYYSRNIVIMRSNTIVDGLEHHIIGEGEHGAPYGGFITVSQSAFVTVRNTILTGHKTYRTIGGTGIPVYMGSYDISVYRAINVSFVNCSQTNDINDGTYWGIMASNFSKNLIFDHCILSRFDAHQGVVNATIRNSTLGYKGITAIGSGVLTLENSTIHSSRLINLRPDYGSTWEGEFIIRDCVLAPLAKQSRSLSLISGSNTGQHDFGYTCYMPERIYIENLHIDDSIQPSDSKGPTLFANFNPKMTRDTYQEKYPYVLTKEVVLRNVTTASGKPLRISDNSFMFRNVAVDTND